MNRALSAHPQATYDAGQVTTWQPYTMISHKRGLEILQAIAHGERSGMTAKVWIAAQLHAQWNTGDINATVAALASDAGTTANEAYRALSRLVEIGALIRTSRGRYAINPTVSWNGSLAVREKAAELV
jgi:hypothetical protein